LSALGKLVDDGAQPWLRRWLTLSRLVQRVVEFRSLMTSGVTGYLPLNGGAALKPS
jgi:hypothetical protein